MDRSGSNITVFHILRAVGNEGKPARHFHSFQQRLQPGFTDRGRGADHLPLGDFIHGIDVVDALDAIATLVGLAVILARWSYDKRALGAEIDVDRTIRL